MSAESDATGPGQGKEFVRLVMIPRYTTLAGPTDFTTLPLDVHEYEGTLLDIWRGPVLGRGESGFRLFLEESGDREHWQVCAGASRDGEDPGANATKHCAAKLRLQWFRVRVVLAGVEPVVTCWAVGFLEPRAKQRKKGLFGL